MIYVSNVHHFRPSWRCVGTANTTHWMTILEGQHDTSFLFAIRMHLSITCREV